MSGTSVLFWLAWYEQWELYKQLFAKLDKASAKTLYARDILSHLGRNLTNRLTRLLAYCFTSCNSCG